MGRGICWQGIPIFYPPCGQVRPTFLLSSNHVPPEASFYSRTVPVSSVPRICCLLSRHGAKAGCNYWFGRRPLEASLLRGGGALMIKVYRVPHKGFSKGPNQEGDLPISTYLPKPQKTYLIKLTCTLQTCAKLFLTCFIAYAMRHIVVGCFSELQIQFENTKHKFIYFSKIISEDELIHNFFYNKNNDSLIIIFVSI